MTITSILELSKCEKPLDESAIPKMIATRDLFKIYQAIQQEVTNAKGVMRITGLPQTTVYRKLTWLLQKGIIKGKIRFAGDNNEVQFFPVIHRISIDMNGLTKPSVKVILYGDVIQMSEDGADVANCNTKLQKGNGDTR